MHIVDVKTKCVIVQVDSDKILDNSNHVKCFEAVEFSLSEKLQ